MTTINTADLIDAPLDWAAAKCEGAIIGNVYGKGAVKEPKGLWMHERPYVLYSQWMKWYKDCDHEDAFGRSATIWCPSTVWAQGGPIFDRLIADNFVLCQANFYMGVKCMKIHGDKIIAAYGPTVLIAAMRAHVTKELGDTVDIPEELL